MALDFLRLGDCAFFGPALPEPYVRFELEKALTKHKLLPDADGLSGQALRDQWEIFRRKLRDVSPNSGPVAITNRILDPLVSRLGYAKLSPADSVITREGEESGGALMSIDAGGSASSAKLRCWAIDYDADLDAPTQRGHAYRFSPVRIAQRVLLATGERVGLLTNGIELRLLLCDPGRPDSHIEIDLNVWRLSRDLPDGYQLLLALACPKGIAALPVIVEDARLKQNKVTKELRVQARRAVEEFIQAILDHPDNATALAGHADKATLAKQFWHEGLIVVYRLLFVLKCESTSDPSRVFRFASTPLWRNTYSPSTALARTVRRVLDEGATSGRYLEDGMRVLFKLFAEGLDHPGLTVRPLGGALFGAQSTPLLSSLRWGELAVAHLLDRLLWSDSRRGRERVHYGPLDVEDLGRVYEALLELEPGIAVEPMCRLRRQKLEVVVPAAQGEKYKAAAPAPVESPDDANNGHEEEAEEEFEDEKPSRGKKTKVEWIEAIAPDRFYLRVGLGRKSSGSYYTPHSFVRFLVQEAIGPQCDQRSPRDNPDPGALLKLKVLDPACGSGHFLVEACRFLADRVYEAARLCDELATKAEHDTEAEKNAARKKALTVRAAELRQRLKDLPDNEDELLSYLPSRSAGAEKAVLSAHDIARAEAICRRLVAVHCIYGADLNSLAVELAKLSLWIESHAEGFPLTFLDHRIVLGNSLTGPFWEKLKFAPGSQQPVSDLFRQNLDHKLAAKLGEALSLVKELEASVGVDVQDIAAKAQLKCELDERLLPFRTLAAAWSGGVMLGTDQPDGAPRCDDDAYADLLKHVGTAAQLPASIDNPNLRAMIDKGRLALPFDLAFPEVFHPFGQPHGRHGFDAVVGNPPWDKLRIEPKSVLATFAPELLEIDNRREWEQIGDRIIAEHPSCADVLRAASEFVVSVKRTFQEFHGDDRVASGDLDSYQCFLLRKICLAHRGAQIGLVCGGGISKNPADTWVRKWIGSRCSVRMALHFVNQQFVFADLPPVVEFALLVLTAGQSEEQNDVPLIRLNLDSEDLLGHPEKLRNAGLTAPISILHEWRGNSNSAETSPVPESSETAHSCLACLGVRLATELHVSQFSEETSNYSDRVDLDLRTPADGSDAIAVGLVPVYGSLSITHFDAIPSGGTGRRKKALRQVVRLASSKVRRFLGAIRFFRLALRDTCGSIRTNARSVVGTILPPGYLTWNTLQTERDPQSRPTSHALAAVAILNSFPVDSHVRPIIGVHVNPSVLQKVRGPVIAPRSLSFLSRAALRLSGCHAGYKPLWREQLGDAWRERGKGPFTWPVLAGDDERWAVRAAIDAVVADAYGLSREQYAHVLSTFNHASYKKAPDLCLVAYDELKVIGLDAFCKKHDPYHDLPLVETLPKPVIELPLPDAEDDEPMLWQERDGQITLSAPGPIFETTQPKRIYRPTTRSKASLAAEEKPKRTKVPKKGKKP